MHVGYCSLDGIEKICRPMCSLPKTKAKAGQDRETRVLNITQFCPETPVLGGKSKIPSKFCPAHCEEYTSLVPSLMDHQYVRRKHAEEAPLLTMMMTLFWWVVRKLEISIVFMTELPDFSLL